MPATLTAPKEQTDQRFVLYGVDWHFYDMLLKALGDRHVFVTYDRGSLELMSPSPLHENYKIALGRMIEALAIELGIEIISGGSMTFRREDLDRGLEPDECYYVKNALLFHNIREVDLSRHPPPDLAIDVDITSSSLDRQAIYTALGVPELWRFDGKALKIYQLGADGQYKLTGKSLNFPFLPLREIQRFVETVPHVREIAWIVSFQKWVRENLKRP
ncbi:MAG: Uma2 family endonuclease [Planctomycetota bacterium]